jgi:hypothetical protein
MLSVAWLADQLVAVQEAAWAHYMRLLGCLSSPAMHSQSAGLMKALLYADMMQGERGSFFPMRHGKLLGCTSA